MMKKNLTAGIHVDQTAAFDVIDHGILEKKLAACRLKKALDWIMDYLSKRKQSVQFQASLSTDLEIPEYSTPPRKCARRANLHNIHKRLP